MTEEYCRQCSFFMPDKGWLEDDDPFWKTHPDSGCMCKDCPRRPQCEAEGPTQDMLTCFDENKGYLDRKVKATLGEGMKVTAHVDFNGGEMVLEGDSPFLSGGPGDPLEMAGIGVWLNNWRFSGERGPAHKSSAFVGWAAAYLDIPESSSG